MSKSVSLTKRDQFNVKVKECESAIAVMGEAYGVFKESNAKMIARFDALGVDYVNLRRNGKEVKKDRKLTAVVGLIEKAIAIHTKFGMMKGDDKEVAEKNARQWWNDVKKTSCVYTFIPTNKGGASKASTDPREKVQKACENLYKLFGGLKNKRPTDQQFIQVLKSYAGIE